MEHYGQLTSENFAGPVNFETPRPDWPMQFLTSPLIIFSHNNYFKNNTKIGKNLAVVFFKIYRLSKVFPGPGQLAVVFHKPGCE